MKPNSAIQSNPGSDDSLWRRLCPHLWLVRDKILWEKVMTPISRLLTLICTILLAAPLFSAEMPENLRGELVIFQQPGISEVASSFEENTLPRIEEMVEESNLNLTVLNALDTSVPDEVKITPLIIYQNYKGRSIYQGRFNDVDKIAHFVRTSRFIPQGDRENQLENVPIMNFGEAKVASPIKITDLEYLVPENHDQKAFEQIGLEGIHEGLSEYKIVPQVSLGRSDRLFYMDFYPIAIEDNRLVISLALFSQFDCHTPVFTAYNDEIIGHMSEAKSLFANAAALLEAEVKRQLDNPENGDGFDPISAERVGGSTWEKLNLALPPEPEAENEQALQDIPETSEWIMSEEAVEGAPFLQFWFPAPLDSYAGEAKEVTGTLQLAERGTLAGATGRVEVDTSSLTMGMPELNNTVLDNVSAEQFPLSYFELKEVQGEDLTLRPEQKTEFTGTGIFHMKGLEIPLKVDAWIRPEADENGSATLVTHAQFHIALADPFGIEGPPGPIAISNRLNFYLIFQLKPAGD